MDSPSQRPGGSLHSHAQHNTPGLTRRRFLQTSAAATAGLMTTPASQLAAQVVLAPFPGMPRPIPGGLTITEEVTWPLYLPTVVLDPEAESIQEGEGDPSTITDFDGVVAIYEGFGGIGTETVGGVEAQRFWAVDARYIAGRYIDMDGQERQGAFTFL